MNNNSSSYGSGPKSGLTSGPKPNTGYTPPKIPWKIIALIAGLFLLGFIFLFLTSACSSCSSCTGISGCTGCATCSSKPSAPASVTGKSDDKEVLSDNAWKGTSDKGYEVHFASYEDADLVPHVVLVINNGSGSGAGCVGRWLDAARFSKDPISSEGLVRRCWVTDTESLSFVSYNLESGSPNKSSMTWDLFDYGKVKLEHCSFDEVLAAAKSAGMDVDKRLAAQEAGVVKDYSSWQSAWTGQNKDAGLTMYLALSPDNTQGLIGYQSSSSADLKQKAHGACFLGVDPASGKSAVLILDAAEQSADPGFVYDSFWYADYTYDDASKTITSITATLKRGERVNFTLAPCKISEVPVIK